MEWPGATKPVKPYAIPVEIAKKIYEAQARPQNGFHAKSTAGGVEVVYKTSGEPIPLVRLICNRKSDEVVGSFRMTAALDKGTRGAQIIFAIAAVLGFMEHIRPPTIQGILQSLLMGGFMVMGIYMLPKLRDQVFEKETARIQRLLRRWAALSP